MSKRARVDEPESSSTLIEELNFESKFTRRIELMKQLQDQLDQLTEEQLGRLNEIIDKDEYGYFNRTWYSLTFALKVKSKLEVPKGQILGIPVLRIAKSGDIVGQGVSGSVISANVQTREQTVITDNAIKFLNVFVAKKEDYMQDDDFSSDGSNTLDSEGKVNLEEILLLARLIKDDSTKPFCVPLRGLVIGDNRSLGLVMPKYRHDLFRFMSSCGSLMSTAQKLRLFKRCVECIDALHSFGPRGLLHNDIKANNFLVGPPGVSVLSQATIDEYIKTVVVTDFGFSQQRVRETIRYSAVASIGGVAARAKGTAAYASPEVAQGLRDGDQVLFTKRSDIFSLGVVLGFIISNSEPFSSLKTVYKILQSIQHNKPRFKEFPSTTPPIFRRVFEWCTCTNMDLRPASCKDVLELLDPNAIAKPDGEIQAQIHEISQRTPASQAGSAW